MKLKENIDKKFKLPRTNLLFRRISHRIDCPVDRMR